MEIHSSLEGDGRKAHGGRPVAGFYGTLVQIAVIDIVFSLDSVITAVGMVSEVPVMVLAIVIAVGIMMFAAKPIGDFVDPHPTIKMLALAFLILVGVALVGEGFELHIPKGYIYFAMAFAFGVEMLNLRLRKARKPIKLHKEMTDRREHVMLRLAQVARDVRAGAGRDGRAGGGARHRVPRRSDVDRAARGDRGGQDDDHRARSAAPSRTGRT